MRSKRWLGGFVVLAACALAGCGGGPVLLTGDFQLGDQLELRAREPDWSAFKTKLTEAGDMKDWGVFLDGHFVGTPTVVPPPPAEVASTAPAPGAPTPRKPDAVEHVVLRLRLMPTNQKDIGDAWRRVLEGKYPVNKRLALSVAGRKAGDARLRLTGGDPADGDYLQWTPWQSPRSIFVLAATVALALIVFWLIRKFFTLRDAPGAAHLAAPVPPSLTDMPFSLSKSQMLLWIVTVPVAVMLVWAMTGSAPAVSASVLALLGLGVGTKLVSGLVDTGGAATLATLQARHAALVAQVNQLNTQLAGGGLAAAQVITLQQQVAGLQAQIGTLAHRIAAIQANPGAAAPVQPHSNGWWADVLDDGAGGIGLHRLQLVLWTAVIWILFWAHVLRNLVIPELDATLVTLSGLSAASFVVLKSREPN